jgi:hypothetical protein
MTALLRETRRHLIGERDAGNHIFIVGMTASQLTVADLVL